MRDLDVTQAFLDEGGCELAPCSTTTDLMVAVKYSASKHPLILKVRSLGFHDRGADISFLSAFPSEKEVLYPPLTFFKPTRDAAGRVRKEVIGIVTIVEVSAVLA
mmetsp:Transcript_33406/g.78158  ORF Transcript_33406/g.78158 Transcript_33406/m.78158 type:complete len:105 (-) Transcript_33406:480-794(-)